MAEKPLSMTQKEMRELGYRVVDRLVEHFVTLEHKPVTRTARRAAMEHEFQKGFPQKGGSFDEVLDEVTKRVFTNIMHLDHPRFFAFVSSPSNFVSVMAEALIAGHNAFAGTWLEAAGPSQIELNTIDWLSQLIGLPPSAGGLFVSGGSVANLTALAVARNVRLKNQMANAAIYFSDQTHSSVERALRVLGFGREQMRKLPSDDLFRLDLKALEDAVREDRALGKRPFCVVANAGTTNTGAVDPLPALAEYCTRERLWLHADGAYGAAAVMCERGREILHGLELVHSLSLDPHKWLFQPYEIGCVLVRDTKHLRDTFHILAEYLRDIVQSEEEINFCDFGIQLTRSFRALKLWMALKTFGVEAFANAVAKGFLLAEYTQETLESFKEFEIVTPAQTAIITFRYVVPGLSEQRIDDINEKIVNSMIQDGFAMISSTLLRGRRVLRMCTINPRTSEEDIRKTIELIKRCGDRLSPHS